MLFSTVASSVASPGPRSTERGELPKVKLAGFANAAVLNQRLSVRSLAGSSGSPTRFARSGPAGNAFVVFAAVTTGNGGADRPASDPPERPPPTHCPPRPPPERRTPDNPGSEA